MKDLWRKFSEQPINIHILWVVGLLVVISALLTSRQGANESVDAPAVISTAADPITDDTEAPDTTAPGIGLSGTEISDLGTDIDIYVEELPVTDLTASGETNPDQETAQTPVTESDSAPATRAQLVLILDDIGYNAEAGQRAINLPGAVTYAVLPYTPHGRTLAASAHRADKEVMLHAPMSNLAGMDLGQGGLTLQQDEALFTETFRQALADIPHIKGVNNHTGSELTAHVQPMQWVMTELKQRGLYFVDSVTTRDTVAAATAAEYQVPSLRRHVFLDNIQTLEAIDVEFKRALALAKQQGFAVAIGHPYPSTLAYLETALPTLAEQNIELIPVSDMIARLSKANDAQETADAEAASEKTTASW